METKPHRVVAVVLRGGEVRLDLVCPYHELGEKRPCMMGMEPQGGCEWQRFEDGAHHDSCPAATDRDATCSGGEPDKLGMARCWLSPPKECEGWDHHDAGHIHEVKDCYARYLIGELGGWSEAVRWHPQEPSDDLHVPIDVSLTVDEDEGVTLTLWEAAA